MIARWVRTWDSALLEPFLHFLTAPGHYRQHAYSCQPYFRGNGRYFICIRQNDLGGMDFDASQGLPWMALMVDWRK